MQHNRQAGLVKRDNAPHPYAGRCVLHVIAPQHLVHCGQGKGPGAGAGALHHLRIPQGRGVEDYAGLFHLAVELACGHTGDIDFGVEKLPEGGRIVPIQVYLEMSRIREHLQARATHLGEAGQNRVCGTDDSVECHPKRIVFASYQLLECGGNWIRRCTMPEDGNRVAHDNWPKTRLGCSLDQHAVSGSKGHPAWRVNKDGNLALLHE